ncbi:MAG: two-component system, OmpR family, sensor kinase, partial [Actinomycetota bacterium]|nr:two-component system, OmpR family, sensor kinase [Actinomycetota bacterium]
AAVRFDELRRELVTTVSHELRTPLTLIQGLVDTLAARWDRLSEGDRMDLVDDLALNVASLDASVLHFIDAARLARDEVDVQQEWVDLAPVVTRVRSKLDSALGGRNVQVGLTAERAWGDPESVSRIIELLMVNAARFSPLGSGITVASRKQPGTTVISVTDQGQGIAQKHQSRVFEPFWRADVSETGVSRGAGLGLFIVKELAERHGGAVRVNSTQGRGSTFSVELPDPPSPL